MILVISRQNWDVVNFSLVFQLPISDIFTTMKIVSLFLIRIKFTLCSLFSVAKILVFIIYWSSNQYITSLLHSVVGLVWFDLVLVLKCCLDPVEVLARGPSVSLKQLVKLCTPRAKEVTSSAEGRIHLIVSCSRKEG